MIGNDIISKTPDQGPATITGPHTTPGVTLTLEGPTAYDETPEEVLNTYNFSGGAPGPPGDIDVHLYGQVSIFFNVETLTLTSIQFFVDIKMPDGTYALGLASTAAITAAGTATIQLGIGTGTGSNVFPGLPGQVIRIRAITAGSGAQVATYSAMVVGRTDF